ncbi:fumarylacetoacetase [Edaphobacter aggregans]|uniref:fumarylacetoacetase n=1 Tax=Edaphobacter aggregans TaxID=570835 RepID=UPI000552C269|nr:fumarylacetoacetase [Edaphobacter aggregans]
MAKRTLSAHRSWLTSANDPATDFPLSHLPYGAFEAGNERHLCVAIGTHLLDLHQCASANLLPRSLVAACQAPVLNPLMALGPRAWALLRETITTLLHASAPPDRRQATEAALHSITGTTLLRPVEIPNYTDFYASIHHATRVGAIFRPDQPLLPNYKHVPIGYHGRASSILPSGIPIFRPVGQTRPTTPGGMPPFGPTKSLDYELELAFYIGQPNSLGMPIPIGKAHQHLFGVSLLNDWSARDIQSWEYQPLGPFLGKSFATTVSPWVTPIAALEPFRAPTSPREKSDPKPLPYLRSAIDQKQGSLDVQLEVFLLTPTMRRNKLDPFLLSRSSAKDLFWTPAQLIAHHSSNGCNLPIGDLIATGTISGPKLTSAGCLLELTHNGTQPLALPTGETRGFLADGDEVILRGFCARPGHPRIGLGECRAAILPAHRSH